MRNLDMKHWALLSAVGFLLLAMGCIEIDPPIQGKRTGSLSVVTNTVYHGCGFSEKPWYEDWSAGGDRRHVLYSVRPKYNYWYAMAAVFSLGLYMPLDLEWRYYSDGEGGAR